MFAQLRTGLTLLNCLWVCPAAVGNTCAKDSAGSILCGVKRCSNQSSHCRGENREQNKTDVRQLTVEVESSGPSLSHVSVVLELVLPVEVGEADVVGLQGGG